MLQACADLYDTATCDELEKALQAVELDQPGLCSGQPASTPVCNLVTAAPGVVPAGRLRIVGIRPNPFNPATTVAFTAPAGVVTTVTVYDLQDCQVDVLFDGKSTDGRQELTWEAKGGPSRVYFVRIVGGEERVTAKTVLLK